MRINTRDYTASMSLPSFYHLQGIWVNTGTFSKTICERVNWQLEVLIKNSINNYHAFMLLLYWVMSNYVIQLPIYYVSVCTRRPVPSTNQALPSCFYFKISWILMEQRCFYFFCPLGFLQGLRSLKHWLLQKPSMKNLDQKFKFLIKK